MVAVIEEGIIVGLLEAATMGMIIEGEEVEAGDGEEEEAGEDVPEAGKVRRKRGRSAPRHGGAHGATETGGLDGLGAFPGSPTCSECSHHGICIRDGGSSGKLVGCRCGAEISNSAVARDSRLHNK